MANDEISLPSVLLIVVLSGLVIRYIFFSPAPSAASSSSSPAARGRGQPRDATSAQRAREAAVVQLLQMFPQMDRRTLLWDLQRTGGSVAATTDRILAGRIDTPPVTFQPPPPPGSSSPSPSSTPQQKATPPKPAEPDLITRYNLQNKVQGASSSSDDADDAKPKGWSSNRDERQTLLQRRRDEMILAARRKMEARIAAEGGAGKS